MKGINGVNFSKKEFIKLIGQVFLPILIIVIIVGIALWIYSKYAEKKGVKDYNNKINFHAALVSIVVTLILLAITVIFSVNFINVMKAENLIESNKIVFYIVITSPIIPFAFLIYLIARLVKSITSNEEEIQTSEIEENEDEENEEVENSEKKEDENIEKEETENSEKKEDENIEKEETENSAKEEFDNGIEDIDLSEKEEPTKKTSKNDKEDIELL